MSGAIYAWVATQKDGKESLVSAQLKNGVIQLVSMNPQVIESFGGLVREMVDEHDMAIDLVRFGSRETLQQVRPAGEGRVVPLKKGV